MGRAKTTSIPHNPWAARFNTGLLITTLLFSFLFFSFSFSFFPFFSFLFFSQHSMECSMAAA